MAAAHLAFAVMSWYAGSWGSCGAWQGGWYDGWGNANQPQGYHVWVVSGPEFSAQNCRVWTAADAAVSRLRKAQGLREMEQAIDAADQIRGVPYEEYYLVEHEEVPAFSILAE